MNQQYTQSATGNYFATEAEAREEARDFDVVVPVEVIHTRMGWGWVMPESDMPYGC